MAQAEKAVWAGIIFFIVRSLKLLFYLTTIAVVALVGAKPPFWKVFMETYKIAPHCKIGKARCLNCHTPPGPPNRNAYGVAVGDALAAANSRMVSAEILAGSEKNDAGDS